MTYTNLFDPSKATLNARISSSGTPAWYGMYISDFIPVSGINKGSDIFRILNAHGSGTGPTFGAADGGGGEYIAYYDASKTLIVREGLSVTSQSTVSVTGAEDGAWLRPLSSTTTGAALDGARVAYVRFGLSTMKTGSTWSAGEQATLADIQDTVITLNEPIVESGSGGGGDSVVLASAEVTVSIVAEVLGVWRYYLLQGSTLSAPDIPTSRPPGGSWSDTEPSYQDGSTNSLYTVDLTVLTDESWSYSQVSLSSSYEAAKKAYNEAKAAMGAAGAASSAADEAKENADALDGALNSRLDGMEESMSGTADAIEKLAAALEAISADLSTEAGIRRQCVGVTADGRPFLGAEDGSFLLVLSGDRISFTEDGAEVAYISNRSLFIQDAYVTGSMRFGPFAWKTRENGNFGLQVVE